MISPGYPEEMPYFTRALAQSGARVIGVSDRPIDEIPAMARENLTHYLQVSFLGDQEKSVREILSWPGIEKICRSNASGDRHAGVFRHSSCRGRHQSDPSIFGHI